MEDWSIRQMREELGITPPPPPRGPAVTTCRACGWRGPGACRHPQPIVGPATRPKASGEKLA